MSIRRNSTTTEPVTLSEIKTLLPLSGTDFDSRITILIEALRMEAEQLTQRSLATSTWTLKLDAFPDAIKLLWPPLASVQSVKYVDTLGVTQTLDPTSYYLDTHSEPGWVLPANGTSWPDTMATANAVIVEYTAGYGASAPAAVKLWIATRIRADIDGPVDASIMEVLNDRLDHLKVYA
jgi:uncharacterized phiE125 gp8 family phage protein